MDTHNIVNVDIRSVVTRNLSHGKPRYGGKLSCSSVKVVACFELGLDIISENDSLYDFACACMYVVVQ